MKIQEIGNSITKALTDVGTHTEKAVSDVVNFAKTKVTDNKDSFEFTNGLKEKNISKETLIGAGVVAALVILAVKCLKGVNNAIKGLKSKN